MALEKHDEQVILKLKELAKQANIDVSGAKVRRSSSRFCFGVEHGDYNGTELFGVGTDRFIWLAYKPSNTGRMRLFSGNFPDDGLVEFEIGKVPKPKSAEAADSWARFPYGVDYILRKQGYKLRTGIDGIIYGNIPGGGMSRSASLTLNLILSVFDANEIKVENQLDIVDMARAVENEYIGSPCGELDQIMILFARQNAGVHYRPQTRSIDYVPFRSGGEDFRIVILDTGTVRSGLEKSTYKIRRAECEEFVGLIRKAGYQIDTLADVNTDELYEEIIGQFGNEYPDLCDRLRYIYQAQQRFYEMLSAWKQGDIKTVGGLFNEDGIGLRDQYKISGPQLEAMCDIARQVPGVLGARMLGGGDKGAAGALVRADSVEALIQAVQREYPRRFPEYSKKFSVHVCSLTDGVQTLGEIGQGRI
jgi:galactokinase